MKYLLCTFLTLCMTTSTFAISNIIIIIPPQYRYKPGDASRDFRVNIIDAMILSYYWLEEFEYPSWNKGDFNLDGKVDDIDAVLMALNWTPTFKPGDANRDNVVDDKDAATLCQNWLKETKSPIWGRGDFNADCIVDDKDVALMAINWTPPNISILIPEPTIRADYVALVIIVCVIWYLMRSNKEK